SRRRRPARRAARARDTPQAHAPATGRAARRRANPTRSSSRAWLDPSSSGSDDSNPTLSPAREPPAGLIYQPWGRHARRPRAIKRQSHARALQIGRALAEKTLKRRKQARQTRAKAIAAHAAPVARAISATGPSALAPAATVHSLSLGTVIAEGDSWFDY